MHIFKLVYFTIYFTDLHLVFTKSAWKSLYSILNSVGPFSNILNQLLCSHTVTYWDILSDVHTCISHTDIITTKCSQQLKAVRDTGWDRRVPIFLCAIYLILYNDMILAEIFSSIWHVLLSIQDVIVSFRSLSVQVIFTN